MAISRQGLCATQLQDYADPAVLPINPQPADTGVSYSLSADLMTAAQLLREAAQRIHALPGAGDEEKRYVLRVTCLREHENAVRQLLLNIAQQQRFTLQGLQSAAADTARRPAASLSTRTMRPRAP